MPHRVRDFLYLDPLLVAQTLSQLDFGVLQEWQETLERTTGKEGSLGFSLLGGLNIGGKGHESDKTSSQVAVEQTAESYASRLLLRLEEEQQLLRLEAGTELDLRRGTVIVTEGNLEQLDLFEQTPKPLFDPGWSPEMQLALHAVDEQAVGKANVVRAGSFAIVSSWNPDHLRVPEVELEGEAEIVGIVRRAFSLGPDNVRTLAIIRPIVLY